MWRSYRTNRFFADAISDLVDQSKLSFRVRADTRSVLAEADAELAPRCRRANADNGMRKRSLSASSPVSRLSPVLAPTLTATGSPPSVLGRASERDRERARARASTL